MAAREARVGDALSSKTNGQTGLCRSAEDVELLNKLTAFTACANRGDVIKTLDAANLVFAHGMFKCGTQRTSVSNRAGILSQCAQRFLGVSPAVIFLACARLSTVQPRSQTLAPQEQFYVISSLFQWCSLAFSDSPSCYLPNDACHDMSRIGLVMVTYFEFAAPLLSRATPVIRSSEHFTAVPCKCASCRACGVIPVTR